MDRTDGDADASPTDSGYDDPAWSPDLLRSHILDTYGVEYSHAHMYRILEKAGCHARQPGRTTTKPIQPRNNVGVKNSKKWPTLKADGYTIAVIDQHTEAVSTNQKPTWFPINSRPRPGVSGGRAAINMLGAVTDAGEHFVALTLDTFTAEVSKHFLRALRHRFGKKLVIVLDNAPYFIAKDLKKQAAVDGLLLEYLPSYTPEMNPLENCWLQLKTARKNRLFKTIDDVKNFLIATISELTAPTVYHYLC